MKKLITLSLGLIAALSTFSAQSQFTKDFQEVRTELVSWDAVRGDWLASSFESMVYKQEIPERTFPEDLTPSELYKLVPKDRKKAIQNIVSTKSTRAEENVEKEAWRKMSILTEASSCKPISARSYGDPHLRSFDGASFSFQTVGEFVLAKSQSGHMEVQARQSAQSDDFSLNTAVAMNVAGDRVCFYANEKPDMNSSPIRLNGNAIDVGEKTYRLPHGGTIVKHRKDDYIVNIIPCLEEQFNGILGNANNNMKDDFKTTSSRNPQVNFITYVNPIRQNNTQFTQQAEKEYLSFLAKDFANEWRVTPITTLFDYGFGLNTYNYTDLSFPRVHRTLEDLTPNQRATAKKSCEEAGILGEDLHGCIYDRGFLNIPANPIPVVRDRTEGVVLKPVERSRTGDTKPKNESMEATGKEVKNFGTPTKTKEETGNTNGGKSGDIEATEKTDTEVKTKTSTSTFSQPKTEPIKTNKPITKPKTEPIKTKVVTPNKTEPIKTTPIKTTPIKTTPTKTTPTVITPIGGKRGG